jgi:hypothetical protein
MDEANCGKGDVSDTHIVSLATETALNNSGLVFSDGTNILASAGDINSIFIDLFIHSVLYCDADHYLVNSKINFRKQAYNIFNMEKFNIRTMQYCKM